ncbi:hypothetical protein ACTFIY_005559 [Dictyostelium cf. discoideum]
MSDQITVDELWAECEQTFEDLFLNLKKGLSRKRYMEIYTKIYNYCSSANEKALIDFYIPKVKVLVSQKAVEIMSRSESYPNDALLLFFRNQWNEWKMSSNVLKNLLSPVNKIHSSDKKTTSSSANQNESVVYSDTLNSWRETAFNPLKNKLSVSLLQIIKNDRTGFSTNLQVLSDSLECYVQLGPEKNKLEIYQSCFEQQFLQETETFYKAESADFIEKNGVCEYMRHVYNRIEQETNRVNQYMPISTLEKLTKILNNVLISNYKEQFASKFLDILIEDKSSDLVMMYSLLSRVNHLTPLKNIFSDFIKSEGLKEIESNLKEAQEKPQVLISILLKIYSRFNIMIKECYGNDTDFTTAMDKSFSILVNENPASYDPKKKESNIPVVLSKFCDQILRKGPHHISDEAELEKKLTEAVCLFKYLPDKDIFMLNYQKMLSKRLVEDLSASEDAETLMINKLKNYQGFDYCTKLTRMITDMRLCKDININFQNHLNEKSLTLPYQFNFYVLTNGSWTLTNKQTATPFKPPSEMLSSITYFESFYKKSYQGRVLTFLYDFSRADVDSRQTKGKIYKLTTTAYQMAILLMFNGADKITRFLINDTIGLDETSIRLPLLALIKTGIIECSEPSFKNWNNDTEFTVNSKFSSKKMKVSCNIAVQIGETKQSEGQQTVSEQEIEKERFFKLQAAIVRIMKSKKTMTHNDLTVETTTQVSKWFTPKITAIKKAIEYLIDQEYIRRTTDDNPSARKYEYMA